MFLLLSRAATQEHFDHLLQRLRSFFRDGEITNNSIPLKVVILFETKAPNMLEHALKGKWQHKRQEQNYCKRFKLATWLKAEIFLPHSKRSSRLLTKHPAVVGSRLTCARRVTFRSCTENCRVSKPYLCQ